MLSSSAKNEETMTSQVESPTQDSSSEEHTQSESSIDSNKGRAASLGDVGAILERPGKYFVYIGLAIMTIMYELDNSTMSSYQTYAASFFNKLPMIATLETAGSILAAICKPPVAKISDVIGRAETYVFTILCYTVGYILCASATSFDTYAGGCVLYAIGQSGTGMLNSILVSDISSMRWRGFSWNMLYMPFFITSWISAFIVDSVVHGIGWRWGIGMFAILIPSCASIIVIALFVFQRRARKSGFVLTDPCLSTYEFCSRIDLGGVMLLSGGSAMLLLPITLAATTTDKWRTAWVDVLIVLGFLALVCLYPYEKYLARHPVVPVEYFRVPSVILGVLLGCIDNISFSATHTYLYPWSMVSHNLSPRDAQFLTYTNGVVQCLTGMITGLVMYKTRRYKWLGFAGSLIRLVGYALMIRLRTNDSSLAELFIVQVVQGVGSGILETVIVVGAQIVVPQTELAQVTSLVMLGNFLGYAIGSAAAGGIYTGTLRERLRVRLGNDSEDEVEALYDSITGTLPGWGTRERKAVNQAYSDVIGYITFAAMAFSVPVIILAMFMPDKKLGDGRSLSHGPESREVSEVELRENERSSN